MTQANVEALRHGYEAFARRDWSVLLGLIDPAIEVDLSRNVFNPGVYHGHDGFMRMIESAEEVWDEFEIRPEEFIDRGEKVVVALAISGKGKGSKVPAQMHLYNVWTIRDGRAVHVAGGFRDRASALEEAAG